MYMMPGLCPVCGQSLEVTRLHCRHCDTAIEGHFDTSHLARLGTEQLRFVEVFLRCEGTIKRVEKELGVSYPTVRARLEDVLRTMGFDVVGGPEVESPPDIERAAILDRLDKGEISSDEALNLLRTH